MNRIRSESHPSRPENPPARLQVARFDAPHARHSSAISYFIPLHYEPNYAYPLLVWLHGQAGDESQLKQVIRYASLRNYVGVAPRGTELLDRGYAWTVDGPTLEAAEQRVFAAIEAAMRKCNIAPDRVFLAGLEGGGTLAMRIALRHPDRFAGAASFGGEFPEHGAPLANLETVRKLPLFFATNRDSESYPQETVCRHLRLFHSASLHVDLRQYPGDDGLTTHMLSDLDRWIMAQVTGAVDSKADYVELGSQT